MHTIKMMESTLSVQDIKALREIIPRAFTIGNDGDILVNYIELNEVLLGQSPKGDDFSSMLDRSNLPSGTVYKANFHFFMFMFSCFLVYFFVFHFFVFCFLFSCVTIFKTRSHGIHCFIHKKVHINFLLQ